MGDLITFTQGTKAKASEVNNNFEVVVPIGAIIAWHKDFANTPDLPDHFVECNGQTLDDTDSPFHGQTIPDINGDGRFIKGTRVADTGDLAGVGLHRHKWASTQGNTSNVNAIAVTQSEGQTNATTKSFRETLPDEINLTGDGSDLPLPLTGEYFTDRASTEPPHILMRWIMRVK